MRQSIDPGRGLRLTVCRHHDDFQLRIVLRTHAGNGLLQAGVAHGPNEHTDQGQVLRHDGLAALVQKQGVECRQQRRPALLGQGQPLQPFCRLHLGPQGDGPKVVQRSNPAAVGLHLFLRAKGLHGLHFLRLHAGDVHQMRAMHQGRARFIKAQINRLGQLHQAPQCGQGAGLVIRMGLMQRRHQKHVGLVCLHVGGDALLQLRGAAHIAIGQLPKIQGIAPQHSGSGLAFCLALGTLPLGLALGQHHHPGLYATLGPQSQKPCTAKHLIVGMGCQQHRAVKLL